MVKISSMVQGAALAAASVLLISCSAGTQVSSLPERTAEEIDSGMKSSALAGLAQLHGWVTVHNQVAENTANVPLPIPGTAGGSPDDMLDQDLYRTLPETVEEAGSFLSLLDKDAMVTDYRLSPNSMTSIESASAELCVGVGRKSGSVKGTQSSWVVYKKGNKAAMLLPGVVSCDEAASKAAVASETKMVELSKQFPVFVADIPISETTALGTAAQNKGEAVLTALAAGTPPNVVAGKGWNGDKPTDTSSPSVSDNPSTSVTPSDTTSMPVDGS